MLHICTATHAMRQLVVTEKVLPACLHACGCTSSIAIQVDSAAATKADPESKMEVLSLPAGEG